MHQLFNKEKLQPTTRYRYRYNPETYKFSGITYETEKTNTTDITPHFEVGHVTCFDTQKQEWVLIKDSEFYSKVSKNYEFKQYETFVLEALLENQRAMEAFLFKLKNTEIENIYTGVSDTQKVLKILEFNILECLNTISNNQIKSMESVVWVNASIRDALSELSENQNKILKILNKPTFFQRIVKWLKIDG